MANLKGSENPFPHILIEEVATDGSATGTPAADFRHLFLGEDGALHLKDSAAAVTAVGGSTQTWRGCHTSRSASQTLTTATWTAISMTATDTEDTDAFHDPSSNADRHVIPTGLAGVYSMKAAVQHSQTNAGSRYVGFGLNSGATPFVSISRSADQIVHQWLLIDYIVRLAVADYIRVFAYQDSGGNNDVLVARFQMTYLGA